MREKQRKTDKSETQADKDTQTQAETERQTDRGRDRKTKKLTESNRVRGEVRSGCWSSFNLKALITSPSQQQTIITLSPGFRVSTETGSKVKIKWIVRIPGTTGREGPTQLSGRKLDSQDSELWTWRQVFWCFLGKLVPKASIFCPLPRQYQQGMRVKLHVALKYFIL